MNRFLPLLFCMMFLLSACAGTTPSTYNGDTGRGGVPKDLASPKNYDQSNGQGPFAEGGIAYNEMSSENIPPVKVAILLPLTGEHQAIGQSLLKSSQLALFDLGAETFQLMPIDTAGNPALAAQAAQEAVNEGAQLILGPLFAGSVEAVQPIASRANVNVIAFSTDWSKAGNNVFLMGFLPFVQVDRVVDYAARQGLSRIALIRGLDAYGDAVERTFVSSANRRGLQVPKMIRLSGGAQPSPADLQALKNAQLDAVFIAVGGQDAANISKSLSGFGLTPNMVQRLGTGLWDDPALARVPDLQGAWFAAPAPRQRRSFEDNFEDLYGMKPPRLSTLSYDATALAAVLAKMGRVNENGVYQPAYDRNALKNRNGFSGIDGVFRFNQNGLIERQLSVLEYRNNSIVEVDAAARRF